MSSENSSGPAPLPADPSTVQTPRVDSNPLDSERASARAEDSGHFPRRDGRENKGDYKGKKRDLGRSAWSKQKGDKRKHNDNWNSNKRQKTGRDEDGDGAHEKPLPIYATKFSDEVLAAESRRPKKKVAVMIGYSGTGYKGMQFASDQKTIEGDLFKAFVAAGAISKANADDPKKSSFVRCARTDKGVHAAGNVISLKLIVEDEDVVDKINQNLTPQIRVWGYERAPNSFSAYQMVDSRIYEYLIPTHSLIPPHPSSWMGRKLVEWAEKKNDTEAWRERQKEVEGYWEKIDAEYIEPILNQYDEDIRDTLEKALWLKAEEDAANPDPEDGEEGISTLKEGKSAVPISIEQNPEAPDPSLEPLIQASAAKEQLAPVESQSAHIPSTAEDPEKSAQSSRERNQLIGEGTKKLRAAYISARRTYRVPQVRLERLIETLNLYRGTRNFHNYTVQKSFSDPSAKRVIKTFDVDPTPIIIDGTEWLSLKVHGQSFMMHQIRKMVAMAALIVRCGADPRALMQTSFGPSTISIPKAPSLGLLLERPVFDSYNARVSRDNKPPVSFTKYETAIEEFKNREIYTKIYADEERENIFGNFFTHVDNFPSEAFLFVTSGGVEATQVQAPGSKDPGSKAWNGGDKKTTITKTTAADVDEEDEDEEQDIRDGAGNEG